jgi:hypothetical protein
LSVAAVREARAFFSKPVIGENGADSDGKFTPV